MPGPLFPSFARQVCLAALLTAAPISAFCGAADLPSIRGLLDAAGPTLTFSRLTVQTAPIRAFYAQRNFQPAWVSAAHRRETARDVLKNAASHGLDPEDYAVPRIADGLEPRTAPQLARLDIMLSTALARYGTDLREGRSTSLRPHRSRPPVSAATLLIGAAAAPDLHAYFAGLAPRSPQYRRLRQALSDYREIEKRGGWPLLPEGPLLRRGMHDGRVTVLRRRLAASKDLEGGDNRSLLFDAALESAIRRVQRRHGLTEDGIVGRRTRAALNVAVQYRLEQIRVNLERRRWMPDDPGGHYIFVNMADFTLKVVEGERTVLTMKVVVGTPYRQTPLFSADMTYIDFNPFWNIPRRIAVEEIIPKARESADYLERQGIRVLGSGVSQPSEIRHRDIDWGAAGGAFPYRLRQDPGPLNPLGRVKFMFPNQFEVYLHDTPSRELFARDIRTFSHGCIRLEKPAALATHLLPSLSMAEVEQIMGAEKRRVVRLAKPVPVHLTYLTAWVNKDGSVHFRRDVYDRDRTLAAALQKPATPLN